jgi:hypothetical protein
MSCENNTLDVRGALLNIPITKNTVFNKTFTLKDSDGNTISLSSYTNFKFRIQTTPTATEFAEGSGITEASNILTCDFNINIDRGDYDYQLVGIRAVGETEFVRGKLKVK